jgi:integrase
MGDADKSAVGIEGGGGTPWAGGGYPSAWRSLLARFEELASPIEARPIGPVTEARYQQVRLRAEKVGWQSVLAGARSRPAHDVARAALARTAVALGRDVQRQVGDPWSKPVAQPWVDGLAWVVAALERCRPVSHGGVGWISPEGGPRRTGKRRGLASLPADWRSRMLAHTPERGPYGLAVACLWLLGVRPGELVQGVRVQLAPDGTVLAEVEGGKQRRITGEAPRGQPRRRLAVRPGPGSAEAVARLQRALAREGTDILVVRVGDARRLSDALRATSRRVFPGLTYVITPYSFRHAWAADAKAGAAASARAGGRSGSGKAGEAAGEAGGTSRATSGAAGSARFGVRGTSNADDVSRALGHAAARTRSGYGTRSQSRGSGAITLVGVAATEPLRGAGRQPFETRRPAAAVTSTSPTGSSPVDLGDHVAIVAAAMAAQVTDVAPGYDLSPPPTPSSSKGRR